MALALDSLKAFGEYHFDRLHKNTSSFLQNIEYDDPFDRFTVLCNKLLKGDANNVSQLEFDSLLRQLMESTPEKVNELVFDIINNLTYEFRNWISESVGEGEFTIDKFREAYSKFYRIKKSFPKQLQYFENCVTKPSNQRTY